MMSLRQETLQEEQEIRLLKEWLPRIGGERRAYIKGATKALLYAQEEPQKMATVTQNVIKMARDTESEA
jgi:hypothetical protein